MADVQLEHGHIRIANRLYEAFLDADFTPTQFKILHVLVRLSFGWRRRTVTVSHAELAAAGGMSASGAFRAALNQLITEGVVLRLEQGTGVTRSTYAVQKDFTQWGRWAIDPKRLARRYGERPDSNDDLLQEKSPIDVNPFLPPDGVPTAGGARTQAPGVPAERQAGCLNAGIPTGSKSNSGETVGPRKDSDRQGKTEQQERETTSAGVSSDDVTDLARAALAGLMGEVGMAKVDEFMAQRRRATHANWFKELAVLVGPAARFLPEDLDGAMRDALICDRPVDGPHAIRAFCATRAAERTRGQSSSSGGRLIAITAGVSRREEAIAEAGEIVGRIRQLVSEQYTQGSGTKRFIPIEAVRALGPEILKAYTDVGGMGRVLALETKPDDIGYLIRDFAGALARARKATPPTAAVG